MPPLEEGEVGLGMESLHVASCLTAAPRHHLVAPGLQKSEIPQPRLTKVHLVKTMFFPVVMQGCESWT